MMKSFLRKNIWKMAAAAALILSLASLLYAPTEGEGYLPIGGEGGGLTAQASQKLTEMTALTSPAPEDLLYAVDDPSGSPLSRKATIANVGEGFANVEATGTISATSNITSLAKIYGTGVDAGDNNITNVGDVALDSISADDGSSFSMSNNWTNAGNTVADLGTVTTADVDGGTIDGTVIGGTTAAAGSFTTASVADTLTANQTAARDIAVFKDSGTTTFSLPDGGGAKLEPAGSPSGSEGLLSYDNANSGFEKVEVYDGNHWRPFDPRTDLREQTFMIHSGNAEYSSEFVWIPVFTHPDLGISMGGFWMAKYEMSQPTATRTDGDPIISDDAAPSTTPAVSVPGVALWDNIQFDEARKAVKNAGEEYHLCSNEEWAAAAHWSQLMGTMPYGNNNSSGSAPGDTTIDAYDCVEGGMTDKLCGTGTGPNAFSLNYGPSGVMDLNGNVWEWVDGLYMDTSGYPYVFTTTLHIDELQGVAESAASQTITDTNQSWTADELAGMYLQQGTSAIDSTWEIQSNGTTTITVDSASVSAAEYSIVEQVATDVTGSAGSSGNRILTLWNDEGDAAADDILPYQAIPRTSDGTGGAAYGTDGFWYSKSAFRAAARGGYWSYGVEGGVFALNLNWAPSNADPYIGFRACRTP